MSADDELEPHQRADWPERVAEYRAGFFAGCALVGFVLGAVILELARH